MQQRNNALSKVSNAIKSLFKYHEDFMRYESTRSMYNEYAELLNIFLILIFGNLIGVPSPPLSITLRLLPYAVDELRYFVNKAGRTEDLISDLVDAFNLEI
ncbi:hypothetical protein JCM14467A_17320 [Vulcanisaeta sp. JCM 14467]